MRPHRPTGGSSYMWWEEGGVGGGGNGATFPPQACAWAPVATRRRSPKRHRQSPRSQPGLAPGRRLPPGDGPRRDTVLTFAWNYPWPCFLERETRWGVFRRSRDRLGTCPPARPLVALGAFTPSPGLRSKNLTWGLAVPMPAVEELVRLCRAPRAAGSLLPIRPLVAASADHEPTCPPTAGMPLIWSMNRPVFLAEGGPGAEKRGAIGAFLLTFGGLFLESIL